MNSFSENKVHDISAAGPGRMSLYQLYLLTGCEQIPVNIRPNLEAGSSKDQSSALILT